MLGGDGPDDCGAGFGDGSGPHPDGGGVWPPDECGGRTHYRRGCRPAECRRPQSAGRGGATQSDEVNLVTATLAKFEFGTEVVLARVVDPRNRWLFGPDMGVDHALDETQMIAELAVGRLTE
jgi:hypothetical protein